LSKLEISALMESFTEVVDSVISREDHPGAGQDTVSRYQNLRSENPVSAGQVYDTMTTSVVLQSTFLSEKMLAAVAKFIGHEPHELSHFFRCMRLDPPGENPNELGWHQDFQDAKYPDKNSRDGLTVWIPLTDVSAHLGSIEVCLGSHTERIGDVRVEGATEAKNSKRIVINPSEANRFERKILELRGGDAVFMNMNVLHRTFPAHQSATWRFTILGRYFPFESKDLLFGSQRFSVS